MNFDTFNTTVTAVLSAAAGWAAMDSRFKCGLLALLGLVLVSFGFLGVFLMGLQGNADHAGLAAAHAMVHAGLILIAAGYLRQFRKHGHKRRLSDWIERGKGRP